MDARISQILYILEKNWRTPPRLADLSREVGMSVSRIEHLFRRETGTSIRSAITSRRLSEAARLLALSELSVKEVRHNVGIRDSSNFASSFKQKYGLPPGKYRAKMKTERQQVLPFEWQEVPQD